MEGFTFEQVAIAKGFITAEQLEEAKNVQKRVRDAGLETEIEEIFVKKLWIAPAQLSAVHALMGRGERDLIPGYEITERLGRGGMGTVYRARHIAMDRIVAIKILLPHFANEKDAVERFRMEAVILAQLNHPNIVQGIDAGFHNGVYYYVMEFVDGESLSHKVNRDGKMASLEAIGYMKQMAEALIYAQNIGLVHRDIKPDNILISREGAAKLTDLGLAKLSVKRPHTTLTQQGWMVGTPAYMAPEQVTAGKDADIRSDMYSLGMSFFTVLAGTPAYQGDTTITVLQQRITHDIPYKKLNLAGVPEGLVTIIRTLTMKDAAMRYQSPVQLLEDLKAVEKGEVPVHAKKLPDSRSKTQAMTKRLGVPPPLPEAKSDGSGDESRKLLVAVIVLILLVGGLFVYVLTRSS